MAISKEKVYDEFLQAISCSQLTFSSVAPSLGLDEKTARKIASAFGGGMGQRGVCGCVTGAYMALGLKYGFFEEGDFEGRKAFMAKRDAFREWFVGEFGTTICPELTSGLYMEDKQELREIAKRGLDREVCAYLVSKSVEKLEEMLESEE